MELVWKNNLNAGIGVINVSDEDIRILHAVGYEHYDSADCDCENNNNGSDHVEIWYPALY